MAATDQHPTDQHSHGVDPTEEPSAAWGWHGTFPLATNIAGWFCAIGLFAMLIGNHTNYVEDVWLIVLGSILVILLVRGQIVRIRSRGR